ncbi:MAG: hypothetical protein IKS68_08700, partial [Mailhella sp.]|nr:hypothetical protein [Mailhella sp.]
METSVSSSKSAAWQGRDHRAAMPMAGAAGMAYASCLAKQGDCSYHSTKFPVPSRRRKHDEICRSRPFLFMHVP